MKNDELFEKALEMSGIDRGLIVDHGVIHNLNIDGVDHILKKRAYFLFVKCDYPLRHFPILFFFDEE